MRTVILTKALLLAGLFFLGGDAMADAVPVELRKADSGWQLFRNGEPFFIRGAGGSQSFEALAAAGGNSIRTWSADGLDEVLDAAHRHGLTVAAGIWLGHERHGFDYSDPEQVAKQLADARATVMRYRDHPALLLWGLGNEMEGFEDGDNPLVWEAVNNVAAMVKELDPHHPTMTVTAFVHGARIDYVHHKSPAIDIHGVNAYGGAQVVPRLLREGGATKPFVLTEFGPLGPWEMPTTDWGAPIEQTSTEKAEFYRESYERGVAAATDVALGSYAFLWGHKMESTETWFGMFLPSGEKTAAVDAMTEIWSGNPPDNLAPEVEPLTIDGPTAVAPGDTVQIVADARDPEGGSLRARWALRRESGDYLTGGDFRPAIPEIEGAVLDSGIDGARVRMPDEPGPYRLFFYAYDDAGGAATANVPILVKGEVRPQMPFPVYEDGFDNMPWAPSGWMGGVEHLTLDGEDTSRPYQGRAAIRLRYEGRYGWVGVAWQHPPNNWGEQNGGFDLTGARELEVWARGEYGGEKVTFGVGLLGKDTAFPDSDIRKSDDIVLTPEWKLYRLSLKNMDLSSIKTGFVVTVSGRRTAVTVYLDGIRYVR